MRYIPRIVDKRLKETLERTGAVLVRGPKWCGKTSTCEQLAASELKMRDPDQYAANMEAASIQPSLLLRGDRPRLIDEWQVAPVLWDAVIVDIDAKGGPPGQFLLTGSATPINKDDAPKHTGTGRITRLNMDPMTLEESGDSTCEVRLMDLFDGANEVSGVSSVTIEKYAELICCGGWPAPIARKRLDVGIAEDYLTALCESDISEAADSVLNPVRARALMRSIARSTAQEASLRTLLGDISQVGVGMSEPTLRIYLNALRRLFVIEEVKAWAPTLRSRTPLRSSPVWHMCDPSLAAAALDTSTEGLLNNLQTMGYLFESLCVRELRVYMRAQGGDVFHYRDKTGLEVDVIVRLPSGAWGAIEVKLGGDARIEEGSKNILKLFEKIDKRKIPEAAFGMVLTGGKYAYTRPDGIHVVPLACLGH